MLLPSGRLWRRDEQLPWVSMYCAPGWFASSVPTPAAYCPGVVVAPTSTIHRPSQAGWEIGTARPRSFDCGPVGVLGWGAAVGTAVGAAVGWPGTGAGAVDAVDPEPSSVGSVGAAVAAVSVGTVGSPVAAVSSVGTGTTVPPSPVGTAGAEGPAVTCGPPLADWSPLPVVAFRPRNCPIANANTIRARLAITQTGTGTEASARCLGAPAGGGDGAGRGGTAAVGGSGPAGGAAAGGGTAAV